MKETFLMLVMPNDLKKKNIGEKFTQTKSYWKCWYHQLATFHSIGLSIHTLSLWRGRPQQPQQPQIHTTFLDKNRDIKIMYALQLCTPNPSVYFILKTQNFTAFYNTNLSVLYFQRKYVLGIVSGSTCNLF